MAKACFLDRGLQEADATRNHDKNKDSGDSYQITVGLN